MQSTGSNIAFERIVMLMLEHDFQIPKGIGKRAYLVEKKVPDEKMEEILMKVMAERAEGMEISLNIMKKNKKFQKEQLEAEGYTEIVEIFAD